MKSEIVERDIVPTNRTFCSFLTSIRMHNNLSFSSEVYKIRTVEILKILSILVLLGIVLGCTTQSDGKTNNVSTIESSQVKLGTASSPNAESQSPVLSKDQTIIDVAKYSGQELELVQLINKSTKLLNDKNEKKYLALFAKGSPISQLNKKAITKIEVVTIGPIKDNSALVQTTRWMGSDPGVTKLYTFVKEEGTWKIYDID